MAGVDVLEAYARPRLAALDPHHRFDEMVDPVVGVRPSWRPLGDLLRELGPSGLRRQERAVAEQLARDGVTYRAPGAEREHPWTVDPVPLVLAADEWRRLEAGLAQRARLLDAVLTDLYGARRVIADGLLPPQVVFGHAGFVRAAQGIRVPGPRQLFLSAADLARGPDGTWQVIVDRVQAPSGTGYAMAGRRAVSSALTDAFRGAGVARLAPFFEAMRSSLQALAPSQSEVARVVLLTSGGASETAFDQAFLASLLGFPLVEGGDLTVRDGRVYQRSIGRLEPVDVILRRVDAEWCDPLELRPDSQLGVPGLLEAARTGAVSVVNGLGVGVLENPALFPFLPRLAETLLGEALALPSVRTWWCGEPGGLRHVLAHLDTLVVKRVSRRAVRTSWFGRELSTERRAELARLIEADPGGWVGQETLDASCAPAAGGHGRLEARPLALRTFCVADGDTTAATDGAGYRVLAGGMARTALSPDAPAVLSRLGATAKDVWVLTDAPVPPRAAPAPDGDAAVRMPSAVSPRVAADLFWLGRYAERAEDLTRLVSAANARWRDVHPAADPAIRTAVRVLVDTLFTITDVPTDVTGRRRDGDGGRQARFDLLLTDAARPGTLAHDLRRVRELADANRDQLSVDTWTVLGGLERPEARFGPGTDVARAASTVRESLLAFAGLAAESMVRDAGWFFLDAGRRLERALQVIALLHGTLVHPRGPGVDALVEESVLTAGESVITHRRRFTAAHRPEHALELLITDPDNPRSVAYQLHRLTTDLTRIGASATRVEQVRDAVAAADARRLALVGPDGRRAALRELLDAVAEALAAVSDELQTAHFPHPVVLQPLEPMMRLDAPDTPDPAGTP